MHLNLRLFRFWHTSVSKTKNFKLYQFPHSSCFRWPTATESFKCNLCRWELVWWLHYMICVHIPSSRALHVWQSHLRGSVVLLELLCVYAHMWFFLALKVCVYMRAAAMDGARTVIRWSASSLSCVFSLLCFVPFLNYSRALLRERVTHSPLPQQHPIKATHPMPPLYLYAEYN